MGIPRIIYLINGMLKAQKSSPEYVQQLQEKRFRKLLHHAYNNSAFYRKLYQGVDLDRCKITDLPVVTKPDMMNNYDDFVTRSDLKRADLRKWVSDKNNLGKMYLNKYIVFQTSGTTGENALIVYDRRAMDFVHACVMARQPKNETPTILTQIREFFSLLFNTHRYAAVLMDGGPYPAFTVALFSPDRHGIFVKEKIFSLMDPTADLVRKLNDFQPDSMFSYPSLLNILAREQMQGRLSIRMDSSMSVLSSGSEPLNTTTRKAAMKAWDINIQDTYGSSECFVMARSCHKFDRMHVMNDICILEIVDRHNNPVPDGQPGNKVLLTNLFNHVQPFIRYEISDVTGISTNPCDCEWPFPCLLPVEGRTDDIFYIDRPTGGYEAVHPYLFLGPIVELDEVREYQLVQTGRNEVTFNYVPSIGVGDIENRVREVLMAGLQNAKLVDRINLVTCCVKEIPRDKKSGKFRQIVSKVGTPENLDESERIEH